MNTRARSITLPHLDGPLPQYVVVHHVPGGDEWQITNIEIYADPELTQLLADDVRIEQFPISGQMALYGALNEHQHEARQRQHTEGLRRLWNDIKAQGAEARPS